MSVMGIAQSKNCPLVCGAGMVRWVGGSRVFADRFASANVRVVAGRVGNGNVKTVGEPAEGSCPFAWVPAFDPWSSDSVCMDGVS